MTLTELRYIVALAKERHFNRAAESCFVSQPTLSVAVKKLEDELGVVLFERTKNDVRLTEVGARVVEQAERTLAEAARVGEIAKLGKDPLAGPLRLGVIPTIAPYLLPTLVAGLRHLAPNMPLLIEEGFTQRIVERLKNSEIDLVIMALPCSEPGLVAQSVYDEAFRVVMPRRHAWAGEDELPPQRLLEEPLLMLGPGNCFRDQVLDLCALAGNGQAPHVLEGSSLETIRYMVASGVGATVMPATCADRIAADDPDLAVRPFAGTEPSRRVGLVWRSSFPRFRVIDVVRQALLDAKLPGTRLVTS